MFLEDEISLLLELGVSGIGRQLQRDGDGDVQIAYDNRDAAFIIHADAADYTLSLDHSIRQINLCY